MRNWFWTLKAKNKGVQSRPTAAISKTEDVSLSVPETLTCDVVCSCPRVRLSGAGRDAWAALSAAHSWFEQWRSEEEGRGAVRWGVHAAVCVVAASHGDAVSPSLDFSVSRGCCEHMMECGLNENHSWRGLWWHLRAGRRGRRRWRCVFPQDTVTCYLKRQWLRSSMEASILSQQRSVRTLTTDMTRLSHVIAQNWTRSRQLVLLSTKMMLAV